MGFASCIRAHDAVLMEGALGERLKREYGLRFDPQVAMAKLIYEPGGAAALAALWKGYVQIAERYGLPFLATTPTRRANRERVERAGCPDSLLADNVRFLRETLRGASVEWYAGGLMGCKGDAYTGAGALTEEAAYRFHSWQAQRFCEAGTDFLYAGIMPTLPEAAGMARAMGETGLPYLMSFTLQANGCLIDGTPLAEAIRYIDSVETPPVCYMTNCVHPAVVREALAQPCNRDPVVAQRFWGIQANTSSLSYAELDLATDLKTAEPEELAREMLRLRQAHPIRIFGGCCGTDHRHMERIAQTLKG